MTVRADDLRSVAAALAGAADPEGTLARTDLDTLVTFAADELVFDDPGLVADVASACLKVIDQRGRSDLAPRLTYLLAQAKVVVGDLDGALDLIDRARVGFEQQNSTAAALRTNFGRSNVLHELGRHREALEVNDWMLEFLASANGTDDLTTEDVALLSATAHQNRGSSLERLGRFDAALEAYADAESANLRLGLHEAVGENRHNRGGVLLLIGRVGQAIAAFEDAAAVFAAGGYRARNALTLADCAEAHLLRGEYAQSLARINDVREVLEFIDAPALAHRASLSAARAYLALNLFPEALATYREAGKWLDEAGMALFRGHAHWGAGLALSEMGDLKSAQREYAQAMDLFETDNDDVGLIGVLLDSARSNARGGDRAGGVERAVRARDRAIALRMSAETVRARLTVASLWLAADQGDDASTPADVVESELDLARTEASTWGLVPLRHACDTMLGHIRLQQRRLDEARALLERVADGFDAARSTLTDEALLGMFLHDKATVFEDLLQIELEDDAPDVAERCLAVIERGRSRTLDDLVAGAVGATNTLSADTDAAADLKAELSAVYGELFDVSGRDPASIQRLQQRAVELEQQSSRLRLDGVDVRRDDAMPLRAVESPEVAIDPHVAILSYAPCHDRVVAVLRVAGTTHVRQLGPLDEVFASIRRLEAQWDRFRIGDRFEAAHASRLEQSTRRVLGDLYRSLIQPLEPLLADASASALVVIPFGPVHRVPFNALHDGDGYLVERMEVSTAPSVASYVRCEQLARGVASMSDEGERSAALVIGVADYFATDVTREVEAVAGCYERADVLRDDDATAQRFLELVNGRTMVHLACHGMFRSDNPMYSSLRLGDRWITALELFGVDLTGATVILSACESARSVATGGDELMGMTRVFLASRAASLIASLWPADDIATTDLMTHLHRRLPDDGPVKALRSAQLALIGRQLHPYYWAPFQVIGAR